jgi:hypothetical protein
MQFLSVQEFSKSSQAALSSFSKIFSSPVIKRFLLASILWLFVCSALLFPFVQDLIIKFVEAAIHRNLVHTIWHERFINAGVGGFIFYFIFSFVFFFNNIVSQKTANKISIVFLLVILAFFVCIIMYKPNWMFGDDHEFITSTAINEMYPFWVTVGRFFPLGHVHYDLPLFVFRCLGINTGLPVEAHFAMIAIFFVVSMLCLYILFKKIEPFPNSSYPILASFFACSFSILGTIFSSLYMSLIFPETQVVMLFSIFMLTYYKALKTDKRKYYIIAFIAAVYSSYCKEPVFGAFLVVAISNLIFRYKNSSKREKIFYFALIVNGVLFITLYYFLSFKNATGFYNEGIETVGRFKLFLSVLVKNPILIIMFIIGFIRLFFVLIKKDREHLYYDSLLFAGMSYVLAYIILHLGYSYYFTPSIILFLPSLIYLVKYIYSKKISLALCLFFSLLPFYVYDYGRTATDIKINLQNRQIFMPYITKLLSEYNNDKDFIWYESDNRITENTFYIAVRDWKKHTLNAFLNYQNKSEGKEFFVIIKPQDYIDMKQNILFFYPEENDQYQPMQEELVKTLRDNDFMLYEDYQGIFIYRRH